MDEQATKDWLGVTPESYLEALKWWNSMTPQEQALREQAYIQAITPEIQFINWKSEEWKIYQLYWADYKIRG